MKIFLIRHLETALNTKKILQGRRDIPILTPSSSTQKQISKNRRLLEDVNGFDHTLISRLKRTRMTAELYAAENITVEPLLDELDFGSYEGRKKEILLAEQKLWFTDPASLTLGEPLLFLENRVAQFLKKYKEAKTILAFGHGAWIRAFVSYVEHGNIGKMNSLEIANNQIICIDYNTDGRVRGLHLQHQ